MLLYADHLLRRFGLAEVVELQPDAAWGPQLRQIADEAWALIEGSAEFRWEDQREGSPTKGNRHQLRCTEPTLVLAPFGVAFSCQALREPVLLLRLATHAPDEIDDGATG